MFSFFKKCSNCKDLPTKKLVKQGIYKIIEVSSGIPLKSFCYVTATIIDQDGRLDAILINGCAVEDGLTTLRGAFVEYKLWSDGSYEGEIFKENENFQTFTRIK